MPLFRRRHTFPIPAILPKTCDKCGARLRWTPVTEFDPVIGLEKVDHYRADCTCGEVHYRDGRGQVVELAVVNLPPDRSEFANSPQGPQPYSGYIEFVTQEREKAAALEAKRAAAAAAPKPAAAPAAAASPAAETTPPAAAAEEASAPEA